MAFIVPAEMPEVCLDCPFRTISEELPVGKGLYRHVSRCLLAPEEIENPYRDIYWLLENKETWCPLKEVG